MTATSVNASPATAQRPWILHVIHARGGGSEKHVHELIESTGDRLHHVFLRVLPDRWRFIDAQASASRDYDYRWQLPQAGTANAALDIERERADPGWLSAACATLGIDLVHVHSLVGSGDDLVHAIRGAGRPYCYTAHDMYLPCPTVHLIDAAGEYCNATTDEAACRRCLARIGSYPDVDIAAWRARYDAFLRDASRVFAPSQWAAQTLQAYFPQVRVTVLEPPPPAAVAEVCAPLAAFDLPHDDGRHVALLGAVGPEKGARHLDALVARIRARGLPLRIVVVGYTDRQRRHQSEDRVLTVHGPYGVGQVSALLEHYRASLVLFPSVWPETFSYTLGEAWSAGRPALVPPLGALTERVVASGAGWVIDGWPDADAMLDQMLALTAAASRDKLEAASAQARAVAMPRGDTAIVEQYAQMLAERRATRPPAARAATMGTRLRRWLRRA